MPGPKSLRPERFYNANRVVFFINVNIVFWNINRQMQRRTGVIVDRVRVSARCEELDNALALTKTTRYVKQHPIFRSSKGVICQVSLVEQFPQEGQVSILYGFLQLL